MVQQNVQIKNENQEVLDKIFNEIIKKLIYDTTKADFEIIPATKKKIQFPSVTSILCIFTQDRRLL